MNPWNKLCVSIFLEIICVFRWILEIIDTFQWIIEIMNMFQGVLKIIFMFPWIFEFIFMFQGILEVVYMFQATPLKIVHAEFAVHQSAVEIWFLKQMSVICWIFCGSGHFHELFYSIIISGKTLSNLLLNCWQSLTEPLTTSCKNPSWERLLWKIVDEFNEFQLWRW